MKRGRTCLNLRGNEKAMRKSFSALLSFRGQVEAVNKLRIVRKCRHAENRFFFYCTPHNVCCARCVGLVVLCATCIAKRVACRGARRAQAVKIRLLFISDRPLLRGAGRDLSILLCVWRLALLETNRIMKRDVTS